MRNIRRAAAATALLGLAGCYSLVPYEHPTPQVGDQLTVDFTNAGSEDMARLVGPRIITLNGLVMDSDQAGFTMAVRSATDFNEIVSIWKGERVQVPLADVNRLNSRKFSIGRTALASSAFLAGLIVAWKAFSGSNSGGFAGGGGGGGTPQ